MNSNFIKKKLNVVFDLLHTEGIPNLLYKLCYSTGNVFVHKINDI